MHFHSNAHPEKAKIVDLRSFRVLAGHAVAADTALSACASPAMRGLVHAFSAAGGGVKGIGIYRGDATERSAKAGFSICAPLAAEAIEADVVHNFANGISGHTIEHTKGGLYAVGRYRGSWDGLKGFYAKMLDEMIPSTGYKYTGQDILEIYLDVDDADGNVVDVCFPVGR